MTTRRILPVDRTLTTSFVRTATGNALGRVKAATGLSNQEIAERLGKSDRASAADLIAGETTMDLLAFIKALADPNFGAAFGNDVLGQTVGMNLCPAGDLDDAGLAGLPVGLSELLTAFLRAYADMKLNHQEVLALAGMLRPLIPHLQSIIAEADRVRG
jgi:hypothetical protein